MQNSREARAVSRKINWLGRLEALVRRIPAQKNRMLSIVVLAAVPLFVLFVGFRILHAREATAKIVEQNHKIQQQIAQLDAQTKEYLAVLSDDDPEAFRDYIVRIAREQLGLSLPGDQVFIDRSLLQSSVKK